MAKIEMGILGGFSGRVGTVVGYYRRGGWYVRAYQPHIKDRKSEAQLQQRGRFKSMIQFASQATGVLRVGLREAARAAGLTEGNVFLRENHGYFSGGSGFTGNSGNSGGIDFAGLRFSKGSLPGVRLVEAAVDEGGALRVRWESLGGVRGDKIHLYIYDAASGRGLAAAATRGEGRAEVLLPEEFTSGDLHVWAFAEGKGGRVSGTAYMMGSFDNGSSPNTTCGDGLICEQFVADAQRDIPCNLVVFAHNVGSEAYASKHAPPVGIPEPTAVFEHST